MSTSREWSIQYDMLKKKIQHQRISANGNGQLFGAEELKEILFTVKTLESQLLTMESSPLQYEISASEIARRKVLLDYLKRQTTVLSISSESHATTVNPMTANDGSLVQRQKDVIKLQDSIILDIESGVERLHGKAVAIGDEAKLHSRLLDDLDSNVEIATAALQAEAKHAERVKEQAQMCWMYICVAVEVVILFLLIIVMVTH